MNTNPKPVNLTFFFEYTSQGVLVTARLDPGDDIPGRAELVAIAENLAEEAGAYLVDVYGEIGGRVLPEPLTS